MMTNAHLKELVAHGATLTLTKLAGEPGTVPLAFARLWQPDPTDPWNFFYITLWPANEFAAHVIEGIDLPAKRQRTGDLLRDGQLLGTIAAMDPDERAACQWSEWAESYHGESGTVFVEWCERIFQQRTS